LKRRRQFVNRAGPNFMTFVFAYFTLNSAAWGAAVPLGEALVLGEAVV